MALPILLVCCEALVQLLWSEYCEALRLRYADNHLNPGGGCNCNPGGGFHCNSNFCTNVCIPGDIPRIAARTFKI